MSSAEEKVFIRLTDECGKIIKVLVTKKMAEIAKKG